jgi:broad specificity phosphatase PhoE
MLKLMLIRHAESIGNAEGRMQGQGEDDLTELGRSQAQKLADRLLQHWRPTHVYSSPLKRAAQTTQLLLDHCSGNCAIEFADELKEFQNGIFQDLTWAEAKQRYPELCDRLESSLDWLPIPGAESLVAGRQRARQFMQKLLERHQADDRLWIVSHSWILQHLIAEVLGCDRSWQVPIQHTALFEFWLERSGRQQTDQTLYNTSLWQIHRFNDHRHLET